jgi:hypothetical protein
VICRRGALIAAVVAALAAPSALASPNTLFKGAVTADENSKLTFKVIKNENGKRRVDVPKMKQVNAICVSGPEEIDVTFGSIKTARISKDGEFDFDNSGVDDEGHKYVAYVRGEISGKAASGNLRFQGPTAFKDGSTQNCDTGELKWTAEKS